MSLSLSLPNLVTQEDRTDSNPGVNTYGYDTFDRVGVLGVACRRPASGSPTPTGTRRACGAPKRGSALIDAGR